MIHTFRVRNFRCLRDLDVTLGPLNFLIGPNNTGKSSLLDAVALLADCVNVEDINDAFLRKATESDPDGRKHQLARVLTNGDVAQRLEYDCELTTASLSQFYPKSHYRLAVKQLGAGLEGKPCTLAIDEERIDLSEEGGGPGPALRRKGAEAPRFDIRIPSGSPQKQLLQHPQGSILRQRLESSEGWLEGLRRLFGGVRKYRLSPLRMAEPCQVARDVRLAPDGFGIAACLDNLSDLEPDRFEQIQDALRKLIPGLENVTFPTVSPGKKSILFHETWGSRVYASEASDGLLLFLAYLTIAHSTGDVTVLLIEEPELGVHPRRLGDTVRILRAISRGELGLPPVQVIATSHSPHLLDCCDKEEIIVFRRDEGGEAHATPLADVDDIDEQLKDFAPGELIYTFGERICESRS